MNRSSSPTPARPARPSAKNCPRCLAKDREDRYQTIKDVAIELRELRRELEGTGADTTVQPAETETTTEPNMATKSVGVSSRSVAGSTVTEASSAEYIVSGIKQHKLAVLVAVVVLGLAGVALSSYLRARRVEVAIDSIAVLPFENRSTDAETEYLSDGLAESLIYRLSQLPNLKVTPTSVAFHYKGKQFDSVKAGNELGVRSALGRITQRGDNLTISANWWTSVLTSCLGEQYDRKMSDLLATQRDCARDC